MGMWIDFRQLRESLDVLQVLQHYRVEFKRRGTQAIARCPLPNHPKDGKSQTFSVNFEKRVFQCFGCGAKGNVLDFIAYMERLNPRQPNEVRKAAEIAHERFGSPQSARKTATTAVRQPPAANSKPITPQPAQPMQSVLVNEPINFALKNLDTKPPYLLNRGLTEETIAHFGLGYCSKGIFAGRIVIPLHDQQGRLIGYAGRIIYDDAIDESNPKYLFPLKRERNGQTLEFAKSLVVYNGHAIQGPVHDLIIVQGFPSVWWLWQHGHRDVVGLMGSGCSVDQAKIVVGLVAESGRVWFLTDGNKDGERCAESLFCDIGTHRFCKWVKLRQGQPTNCEAGQLTDLLSWKVIN